MSHLSRRNFLKRAGSVAALGFIPQRFLLQPLEQGARAQVPQAITLQAVTAYQLQTPHYALIMDLDGAGYQARFNQLTSQGYRSIWVQGSTNNGGAASATFSGIFVRDGGSTDWYQRHGMDAAAYQTEFNNGAANGYEPVAVSGYTDSGVTVFAAIWQRLLGSGYAGVHNTTNSGYQAFVNNNITNGLRPVNVDGYAIGAADYYISVWDNANNLPWVARHGLTSAQYQTEFNTWIAQGFHVYSLSAYQVSGMTYFAALWVKDGVNDWYGRHDWLPGSLFNDAVSGVKAGYQPIVIEGYDSGSSRNFGGVWVKKNRTWSTTGTADPNLVSFDNTVMSFMQQRNIPSAALAVTQNSRLVYARGYRWDYDNIDPVQPDSLFRIASVTKPLTSMGILLLVQQGKLNLTDKLVNLISLGPIADSRMSQITVQYLLQHLGGWNRDTTFDPMFYDSNIASYYGISLPVSKQNIINYMTAHLLQFTPGTMMNYSNYGYLLLGRIIEAVSGQTYANFMKTQVFSPLGMNNIHLGASLMENRLPGEVSYYVTDPNLYGNVRSAGAPANVMIPYGNFNIENMDSHGGWAASAVDLARFSIFFDATSGYPFLTKSTIDQIFAVPPIGKNPDGSWYGCGWAVRTAGSGLNTWHNGSLPGTSTLMVRRSDGLNWVILFNQRDDPNDPSGSTYGDIDPQLHTAANAVTKWPATDLFPAYGIPSLFSYHISLPFVTR